MEDSKEQQLQWNKPEQLHCFTSISKYNLQAIKRAVGCGSQGLRVKNISGKGHIMCLY